MAVVSANPFARNDALWDPQAIYQPLFMNPTEMNIMERRLKSFHSWSPDFPDMKYEMAKEGLYYTGVGDIVRCFKCGKQLSGWKKHESPSERHKRVSENCPMVKGEPCGNVDSSSIGDKVPKLSVRDKVPRTSPLHTDGTEISVIPGYNDTNKGAIPKKSKKTNGSTKATKQKEKRESLVKSMHTMGFNDLDINEALLQLKESKVQINPDSLIEKIYEVQKQRELLDFEKSHTSKADLSDDSSCTSQTSSSEDEEEATKSDEDVEVKPVTLQSKIDERKNNIQDQIDNIKKKRTCTVCGEGLANVLFLPCAHLATCTECCKTLRYCPLSTCQKIIRGTKQVFFA